MKNLSKYINDNKSSLISLSEKLIINKNYDGNNVIEEYVKLIWDDDRFKNYKDKYSTQKYNMLKKYPENETYKMVIGHLRDIIQAIVDRNVGFYEIYDHIIFDKKIENKLFNDTTLGEEYLQFHNLNSATKEDMTKDVFNLIFSLYDEKDNNNDILLYDIIHTKIDNYEIKIFICILDNFIVLNARNKSKLDKISICILSTL